MAPYRRRQYLVKQWLQLRYMLLLAGVTAAGAVAYYFILLRLLRPTISSIIGTEYATLQENLWISLYPTIAKSSLVFLVLGVLVVLLLFRLFNSRISQACEELESHYQALAGEGAPSPPPLPPGGVPEFRRLGDRETALMAHYRGRWDRIAAMAAAAGADAAALGVEREPTRRLLLLRGFEERHAPVGDLVRKPGGGEG